MLKNQIMKAIKLFLGAAVIAVGFSSCKDEKKVQAEKSVDTYVVYVDSISKVDYAATKENWKSIQANYELRNAEAEAALQNLKDDAKAQERIDASRAKYEELNAKITADEQAA